MTIRAVTEGFPVYLIVIISILGAALLVGLGLLPYCFFRCVTRIRARQSQRRHSQQVRDSSQQHGSSAWGGYGTDAPPTVITMTPPPYSRDAPEFSDVTSTHPLAGGSRLAAEGCDAHDNEAINYVFPAHPYNRLNSESSQDEPVFDMPPPSYEESTTGDRRRHLSAFNNAPEASASDNRGTLRQTTRQSFVMEALAQSQLASSRSAQQPTTSRILVAPGAAALDCGLWQAHPGCTPAESTSYAAIMSGYDNKAYATLDSIPSIAMKPATVPHGVADKSPSDTNEHNTAATKGAYANDAFMGSCSDVTAAGAAAATEPVPTPESVHEHVTTVNNAHGTIRKKTRQPNNQTETTTDNQEQVKKRKKSKSKKTKMSSKGPPCGP